jgi:hypothetical protein
VKSDDLVWCLGRGAGRTRIGRGSEIDLPLEGDVPAGFSLKRNYPGRKWATDSAHIKYRLDTKKDVDSIDKDVLQRMFEFNQPYLQACPYFSILKSCTQNEFLLPFQNIKIEMLSVWPCKFIFTKV